MKKLITLLLFLILTASIFAKNEGRTNILDFKSFVKNPGTNNEDWQPAFQKAITAAFKANNILYIPSGNYQIFKTINIYDSLKAAGKKLTYSFNGEALKIVGDGRFNSIIWQKNDKLDLLDWSAPEKRKNVHVNNFTAGEIKDVWLRGGKICLKALYHNRFKVSSCYITESKYAGIYTSGWSNTFSELIIRKCYNYGILAKNHMNDTTFKDIYMQNCDVGIMIVGGTGVRIANVGIEGCTYTAITAFGIHNLVVRDSYFEGNGLTNKKLQAIQVKKYGLGSIALNNIKNMQITSCVFRGTTNLTGFINIGTCDNASIQYNAFQLHKKEAGFYFNSFDKKQTKYHKLTIKNNIFYWAYTKYAKKMKKAKLPVKTWYYASSEALLNALSTNNNIEKLKDFGKVQCRSAKSTDSHDLNAFQ